MKNTIVYIVLGIAIIMSMYSLHSVSKLSHEQEKLEKALNKVKKAEAGQDEEEEEIEVADIMTKFQRHSNKLWFAGQAENWELAEFYVHELEEAMEIIEQNRIMDDGVNLSTLIGMMGLEPLKQVDAAIDNKNKEDFSAKYQFLVTNCNNCHASSKHAYINIKAPETPVFDNQVYEATN